MQVVLIGLAECLECACAALCPVSQCLFQQEAKSALRPVSLVTARNRSAVVQEACMLV